jgi:DNA-directed RNA polymerase subunit RPC12/RpoP
VIPKKTLEDCELAYICAQCRQEIDGEPIMVRGDGVCKTCAAKPGSRTEHNTTLANPGAHACGFCDIELKLQTCYEHVDGHFREKYGDDYRERWDLPRPR